MRLAAVLTPKAGQTDFSGIASDPAGNANFKAGVEVPSECNKANKAFLELLARDLNVQAIAIRIASVGQARQKLIQITRDPA